MVVVKAAVAVWTFLALGTGFTAAADVDLSAPSLGMVFGTLPENPPEPEPGERPVKWPTKSGVLVGYVNPYGFLASKGLRAPAIIDVINSERVTNSKTCETLLKGVKAGEDLRIHAYIAVPTRNQIKWVTKTIKGKPPTKLENLKGQIITKRDDVAGVTFFRHVDSSDVVNDQSEVALRIAETEAGPIPQLLVKYVAKEWVFMKQLTFIVNGEKIEIDLSRHDVKHDNDSGIWEWCLLTPAAETKDDPIWSLMETLANGGDIDLAYHGSQYRKDRELSPDEIGRIGVVWNFYHALKNGEVSGAE